MIVKETHSHKHKSAKGSKSKSKSESTKLSLASRKAFVIPAVVEKDMKRMSLDDGEININDDTINIDLIDDTE